jgi:hypothetical protein
MTTPFAPGRPERRRILPPLRTALLVGAVIGILGIPTGLYRWGRGLLGCDPPPVPPSPEERARNDTTSAFVYAQLLLTSGTPPNLSPEGWIVAAGSPAFASHLVRKRPDGKTYLCDAWGNPIVCRRRQGRMFFQSFGPDGRDNHGRGDDLEESYPLR